MGESAELELELDTHVEPVPEASVPESKNDPDPAAPPPAPSEQTASPAPEEDESQKVIARYAFEARVAERKAKDLEHRLQTLEAKSTQTAKPEVPPMPDPLSMTESQFREHAQKRDDALVRNAQWEAEQRQHNLMAQQAEQERQRQQQEATRKAVETYTARSVQLGLKQDELQHAGNMVAQFGIDLNLADMILHDEQGPLITKYLAQNLMELDEINRLPIAQAALRIGTVVKQKAAALKPRVSAAPDPIKPIGGGNLPHKELGPEGASYD